MAFWAASMKMRRRSLRRANNAANSVGRSGLCVQLALQLVFQWFSNGDPINWDFFSIKNASRKLRTSFTPASLHTSFAPASHQRAFNRSEIDWVAVFVDDLSY
jgi:hypothetical protein